MGKASTKAQNRYIAKAYDRINLTVPKGKKDSIQAHAATLGESVNGFIGRAITEAMERDGGGAASEISQQAAETTQGSGVVSLPSDTLETAQMAAEATGEAVGEFLARAVETQAQRDQSSLRMGLNPVTGDRLEKEA